MMMRMAFALCLLLFQACTLSLSETSIEYDKTKSFGVDQFKNKAGGAPAILAQQFSEQLKLKVLNNTRLRYLGRDADIQFSGTLVRYDVSSFAPQPGETTASQRLTIDIAVKFINTKDEKQNWEQTFSRFEDFSASSSLAAVQNQLVRSIYDQIIEDIFNKAFSNW